MKFVTRTHIYAHARVHISYFVEKLFSITIVKFKYRILLGKCAELHCLFFNKLSDIFSKIIYKLVISGQYKNSKEGKKHLL